MFSGIRDWFATRKFRSSLTRGERLRLDYWGATGNPDHTFTTTPSKIAQEHAEQVRDLTAEGISAAEKGKR